MEKEIMSKSNDTLRPAALEDHRSLADSELDAVSGGFFRGGFIIPMPTAKTHSQIEDPRQFGEWITETER
jgi:hypothetical protein